MNNGELKLSSKRGFNQLRRLTRLGCFAVLIIPAVPVPAAAQTAADATKAATKNDVAEPTNDIIVTAEKRSVSLQRSPAAITAVTGVEIARYGATDLPGLSNLFPSARLEPFFASAHIYVRGIGAEQDRVTVDQLVNVFVDGVVMPRELVGASQNDVAAVELLPGPQGTLYGASSVGGILNIRNNRPGNTDENYLSTDLGSYNEIHISDVQNFRISDVLSIRGSVDYVNHSAYETTDRWTANTLNLKLGILYSPSPAFSAYVWGQRFHDDSISQETGFTDVNGNWIPNSDPWDSANDCATKACNGVADRPLQPPQRQRSDDYIAAGQFDWHLGDLTITDIPSYLKVNLNEMVSTFIFTNFLNQVHEEQLTNELKVSNDSRSRLQWLAGLYLYQNKANSQVTFANFAIPYYKLQNVAPYAQLTYTIGSSLHFTAGARYTRTRKIAVFTQPNALPETSASWAKVDWKLGVQYDLSSAAMAYATYQTGSSPGTFDPGNVVDGRPNITKLTDLRSYTAGFKTKLFNSKLTFNDEVFYYDYKNFLIQTITCSNDNTCYPLQNVYLNAPKLKSWGNQLDLSWFPTPKNALHLGYSFTSAKTGHWITNAGADLSNKTLLEAPRNTFTIGAQHSFTLGNGDLVLRADSYVSSGYYADFQTNPGGPVHIESVHQRPYSTTNVSLTYNAPANNWSLGLWARNLENDAQFGPASTFGAGSFKTVAALVPIAGIPRTFGMRFTLRSLMGS